MLSGVRADNGVIYCSSSPECPANGRNICSPPAPPADSSSDEDTGRSPLQDKNTLRKRKAKSQIVQSPVKKQKQVPPSPAYIPSDKEEPDEPIPRRGRKRRIAPSAPASITSANDPPSDLFEYSLKIAKLRHIESIDKLAILQEENRSKELDLHSTHAKTLLVQLQIDYAQTMERVRTADPAFAGQIRDGIENAAGPFCMMFEKLAGALMAFSNVQNSNTLKLRADADNARNELLKTLTALGNHDEFDAIISAIQEDKKVAMVRELARLKESEAQVYDSRERWVKTVSLQMTKVQSALVGLGGFHWRMMDVFLDSVRETFPEVVDTFEQEAASLKL